MEMLTFPFPFQGIGLSTENRPRALSRGPFLRGGRLQLTTRAPPAPEQTEERLPMVFLDNGRTESLGYPRRASTEVNFS